MGIYVCAVPMLYTLRIFGDFAMRFFRLNLHSRHLGPQNSQRTILSVYYSSCKCMIWLDQLRLTSVQKIVRLLLLIRTSKSRENRNSSLGNSFHLYMLYIYIFIGYQPNKMLPEKARAFHRVVLEDYTFSTENP